MTNDELYGMAGRKHKLSIVQSEDEFLCTIFSFYDSCIELVGLQENVLCARKDLKTYRFLIY
jgi:hypothetical protein